MYIHEQAMDVPVAPGHRRLLEHLGRHVAEQSAAEVPIRVVVSATDAERYRCETGLIGDLDARRRENMPSIFRFRRSLAD